MGSNTYTATITSMVTVKFQDNGDDLDDQAISAFEEALGYGLEEPEVLKVSDVIKEVY